MTKTRILIIEDEEDVLALLFYNLTKSGYEVLMSTSGEEGLELAQKESPDLVLLDLMLPKLSGIEICQKLKKNGDTRPIPIIMLTAKSEKADVLKGLESGADDYIIKPFDIEILLARVSAVLRRRPEVEASKNVTAHGVKINIGKNEASINGSPIRLTRAEFLLLNLLLSHPGWVYSRSQIIDSVHGRDHSVTDRAVDVLVLGLRRKMGRKGRLIETVRGAGYRMRDES